MISACAGDSVVSLVRPRSFDPHVCSGALHTVRMQLTKLSSAPCPLIRFSIARVDLSLEDAVSVFHRKLRFAFAVGVLYCKSVSAIADNVTRIQVSDKTVLFDGNDKSLSTPSAMKALWDLLWLKVMYSIFFQSQYGLKAFLEIVFDEIFHLTLGTTIESARAPTDFAAFYGASHTIFVIPTRCYQCVAVRSHFLIHRIWLGVHEIDLFCRAVGDPAAVLHPETSYYGQRFGKFTLQPKPK